MPNGAATPIALKKFPVEILAHPWDKRFREIADISPRETAKQMMLRKDHPVVGMARLGTAILGALLILVIVLPFAGCGPQTVRPQTDTAKILPVIKENTVRECRELIKNNANPEIREAAAAKIYDLLQKNIEKELIEPQRNTNKNVNYVFYSFTNYNNQSINLRDDRSMIPYGSKDQYAYISLSKEVFVKKLPEHILKKKPFPLIITPNLLSSYNYKVYFVELSGNEATIVKKSVFIRDPEDRFSKIIGHYKSDQIKPLKIPSDEVDKNFYDQAQYFKKKESISSDKGGVNAGPGFNVGEIQLEYGLQEVQEPITAYIQVVVPPAVD